MITYPQLQSLLLQLLSEFAIANYQEIKPFYISPYLKLCCGLQQEMVIFYSRKSSNHTKTENIIIG